MGHLESWLLLGGVVDDQRVVRCIRVCPALEIRVIDGSPHLSVALWRWIALIAPPALALPLTMPIKATVDIVAIVAVLPLVIDLSKLLDFLSKPRLLVLNYHSLLLLQLIVDEALSPHLLRFESLEFVINSSLILPFHILPEFFDLHNDCLIDHSRSAILIIPIHNL